MKTLARFAFAVSVGAVCLLGVSTVMAGKKGIPAPPPPVLCGCVCSDGSIVIVHAENEAGCPAACANACPQEM